MYYPQAILDNGRVLVYGKLDGDTPIIWPTDQVSTLPITFIYEVAITTEIEPGRRLLRSTIARSLLYQQNGEF